MRPIPCFIAALVLLTGATLVLPAPTLAGVPSLSFTPSLGEPCQCNGDSILVGLPEPTRSNVGLSAPTAACQYRFRSDGNRDQLVVSVTLRNWFDQPICDCETSITLNPVGESSLCSCTTLTKFAISATDGTLQVQFGDLGGHGEMTVDVTTHCCGNIALASIPIEFTSPDLDASCGTAGPTNVIDLGLWAQGLPPSYRIASDYDCEPPVSVIDLGFWAGGLSAVCGP